MKSKFVLACLLGSCVGSASADALLAADALRQLISRQETSTSAPPPHATRPASGGVERKHETLRPAETLDGLIKRTWPGLPSKEIWVRRVYVDLNPKAFVEGNPNLLTPSATLTIPSREDLRASFAASHPQVAALFDKNSDGVNKVNDAPPAQASRNWVRFP